jgi:tripartite-type tricarboxylate transporter receptor subunit TctC
MAQWLSERLGQQFVVENRPGAGSNIAVETVVKAPPDGHTLLMVGAAHAINATLYDKLSFDFLRDIAPVAGICRENLVMVVHPSFPARTVPEFIANARANPRKITMASSGNGSTTHVSGELFKMMAGIDMVHVPYRGGGQVMTDLIAGQVQVSFMGLTVVIQHVRSGKARALAVTTATRSDMLPDIPTVGDFVPGYEAIAFWGIGAPRNTPAAVIDRLNTEINAGLSDPKLRGYLVEGGGVLGGSPAEFGKLIADETEKWGKVIRSLNIKAG